MSDDKAKALREAAKAALLLSSIKRGRYGTHYPSLTEGRAWSDWLNARAASIEEANHGS